MQRRMLLAATMSALAAPAVRAQQQPFPNRSARADTTARDSRMSPMSAFP
jgi:hypothetical protein